MAPGITGRGDRIYKVAHNLIKSHAKAYRAYENEFKDKQKGNRDHKKKIKQTSCAIIEQLTLFVKKGLLLKK